MHGYSVVESGVKRGSVCFSLPKTKTGTPPRITIKCSRHSPPFPSTADQGHGSPGPSPSWQGWSAASEFHANPGSVVPWRLARCPHAGKERRLCVQAGISHQRARSPQRTLGGHRSPGRGRIRDRAPRAVPKYENCLRHKNRKAGEL